MSRGRVPAGVDGREWALVWRELQELRTLLGRGVSGTGGFVPPGETTTRVRIDPDNPRRVLVTTDIAQPDPRRLRLVPSTLVRVDPANTRRVLLTLTEGTTA